MKLLRFLFTVTLGAIYGLMFAQRPGKKLREDLKKSDEPLKTLFKECRKADTEALETISQWAKESEDLQNLIKAGKSQFTDFVSGAKQLGKEGRERARNKLEELAANAHEAAEELKEKAVDKALDAKDKAKEKAKEVKQELGDRVKTVRKRIGK